MAMEMTTTPPTHEKILNQLGHKPENSRNTHSRPSRWWFSNIFPTKPGCTDTNVSTRFSSFEFSWRNRHSFITINYIRAQTYSSISSRAYATTICITRSLRWKNLHQTRYHIQHLPQSSLTSHLSVIHAMINLMKELYRYLHHMLKS